MFNSKQNKLIENGSKKETSATNAFVQKGLKRSARTLSENGALKYSTTGDIFVDQFSNLGSMKQPRDFDTISSDVSKQWAISPRLTVAFIFFIRIVTRIVSLFDGVKTKSIQRGAGLKHEGIMRMMWLHIYHPEVFWNNIQLYISIGSWKDIIQMLSYDLQYNGWNGRVLNWDNFGKLILAGLENPNTRELVKKYLPQIKSNSQCKTLEAQADNIIAKWICDLLFKKESKELGLKSNSEISLEKSNEMKAFWYKKYRKLKSSGTGHQWQQLISQGKHNLVDFNTVHGRALSLMVSSKYISNQGLEKKYEKWISSKPIAKFTGYVHELFKNVNKISKKYQIDTLNAQFMGLVETAKKNAKLETNFIVVRDTSGSMGGLATGTNQTCYDIAKGLALFFSEMLKGEFSNSWIEFNRSAKMHVWQGKTPYEKWKNDRSSVVGSTNFLSVIGLFVKIKNKGVKEKDFPSGIICISDMEFDPSHLDKTNVKRGLELLEEGGFSKKYISNFKIILWNLQRRGAGDKFETYGDKKNVFYFSGYDGSIIAFLTGIEGVEKQPETPKELFEAAMNQEIMQMIKI